MALYFAPRWWAVALRGVAAILFGLLTFFAPGISIKALIFLFGAYAFADGIFNLVAALQPPRESRWGVLVLEALASLAVGVMTLIWPVITALVLLYMIAFWAVVTGAMEIAAAIRLRKEIKGEWLLALGGALSVVFGFILVLAPAAGALALAYWVGAYALVFGGVMVALAFRLRRLGHDPEQRWPKRQIPIHA